MFYELLDNDDLLDELPGSDKRPIYAAESNLDDIEYKDVKKGYFDYLIKDGKELSDLPEIKFRYSSKVSKLKTEYLLNYNIDWPIVHQTVKEEFEKQNIKGKIQYIPITLADIDTDDEIHEYYAMNILNHIEAIDLKKSDHNYDEEFNYYAFLPGSIYLDESICEGHDIFRASKYTAYVYVSQKVKDIIEKHEWVGFKFREEKVSQN